MPRHADVRCYRTLAHAFAALAKAHMLVGELTGAFDLRQPAQLAKVSSVMQIEVYDPAEQAFVIVGYAKAVAE